MTTIGNYNHEKTTNKAANSTTYGATLSCWSCEQKLAMIASFAILALFLVSTACSKQSPKAALVGVSNSATIPAITPATFTPSVTSTIGPISIAASPLPAKKTLRKRPSNVTYSDTGSGVSFLYPRKAVLTSADGAQSELTFPGDVPMSFVQPGGIAIAAVALPASWYPGTDFESAFFAVNINRKLSEQECTHFAVVDTQNADGETVEAEKVKVGPTEMEMTSNFSASVAKQVETQYYHHFENGACYEYVLGLGTEGFATEGGIEHVKHDAVFAKLEKILATVKVNPIEQEHLSQTTGAEIAVGKD